MASDLEMEFDVISAVRQSVGAGLGVVGGVMILYMLIGKHRREDKNLNP